MPLPSSGPISLGQIQTEFSGSNPIGISEYYRNGLYTTSNNTNVPIGPAGVQIKLSDFYGARRAVFGCTDPSATNYNSSATDNDGSCSYPPPPVRGCTDPSASNYNPNATVNDGSCSYPPPPVRGCTDPNASNYNPNATVNDGSCSYPPPTTTYSLIPLYRFNKVSQTSPFPDHYCSTDSTPVAGYVNEGKLCDVFSTQAPGTILLIDDDDNDGSSSGRPYAIAGYGYKTKPSNNSNVQPIYAVSNNDTMWSLSPSEGNYSFLRIEFYAPTQSLTI